MVEFLKKLAVTYPKHPVINKVAGGLLQLFYKAPTDRRIHTN